MKISKLAESISTSPLLTLAAQINQRKQQGQVVYNMTVGDFDPNLYPIPAELTDFIKSAYDQHETNYPGAFGLLELRQSIAKMVKQFAQVDIDPKDFLVASGSRPLIYSLFLTVVDEGDQVIFPVPSWNNDYYCMLSKAQSVRVETQVENNFFPTVEELKPHLKSAVLISMCSPQNPTGTILSEAQMLGICEMVVAENKQRDDSKKPLYIMFDQVYWLMAQAGQSFHHALKVCPEIKQYAVFIDGVSKGFAGTGVRVGWANGPNHLMAKMRAFVAHIGAWAPRAEQVATGQYLDQIDIVELFLKEFKNNINQRFEILYQGFMKLKLRGFDVDAIEPQAGIYVSVRINMISKTTANGKLLSTHEEVHQYMLDDLGVGILPFSWFGAQTHDDWYRISVGTCSIDETKNVIKLLENAFENLN